MDFFKTHPVYCKHHWNHGQWPAINSKAPTQQVLVQGYMCQRCQTVWQTIVVDGVIKAQSDEPKMQIGYCEIPLPMTEKETPK